ncbi:right-handed parallel beta-helix repeat-containing protein, partial [Methylomonas koyamae]|uniref:right-handed parallel beta-helix repeat-containing protein n=1 Tax=Methylomonas koyamae TaxID=702114 RepID=UPI00155DCBEC
MDRGNKNSGAYVFELQGADDVSLEHLSITGGYGGIQAANGQDSDHLSLIDSRVWNNNYAISIDTSNDFFVLSGSVVEYSNNRGVYVNGSDALIEGNEIARNSGWGIDISGSRGRVLNNSVYANSSGGINASVNNGWNNRILVQGNRSFDNASGTNIAGYYNSEVRGNEVWGSAYGIAVYYGAQATGNQAWGNTTGLYGYSNAIVQDNRVWANGTGITLYYGSTAQGNRVYGNSGAGVYVSTYDNLVTNNVIEANGGAGVQLDGAYQSGSRTRVENNTIVATGSASAIQVQGSSSNVRIRNNILDVRGSGYALNVASDSQQGYLSDYNLFMLGASAKLAYWEDRPFANRTDWFYEVGQDRNSLTADARFIDIDGADGVVGWDGSVVT